MKLRRNNPSVKQASYGMEGLNLGPLEWLPHSPEVTMEEAAEELVNEKEAAKKNESIDFLRTCARNFKECC